MLISDYLSSNIIMFILFYLTHFRELGQIYKNIFVRFLVQMKTSKFTFEIIWPLVLLETLWVFVFNLIWRAAPFCIWNEFKEFFTPFLLLLLPWIVDILLLVRTKSTTKKLLIYSDIEIVIVECIGNVPDFFCNLKII